MSSGIFEKTSLWFQRAKAALLDQVPCAQGCSHCCRGLFPVTILDRNEIQRGLRALQPTKRRTILRRARAQVKMIERAAPRLVPTRFIDQWTDGDVDALAERFADLDCPALQSDGSCGLYAFRPLTCRSMGIPHEAGGLVEGACAIQTAVPLIRLSQFYREEEERLVREEASHLARLRAQESIKGEEMFLPYAFLPDEADDDGSEDT
ncbi:MAG: YkgJ family cysteine cluster protein [Nitrospira sp.]|nr:YkgJ family cysteine cluster protein [Nitrospira sp.]